ncbi:TetR/AcrR family transcriptional regulator [Crassaminicella profunda]|uniref:TetR/AcrR family transcriptional regulator n=1 Tax=Crassaminicella profunda TaxID=1286698 RepID=UPI001CA653DD|nr:TetR/AcrR family transcriptional regulator [Crassaminicella profunda]QZY53574.1 TetR/AcrR family transcriptional regulator [Crassaminicella profunda]
MNKKIIQKKRMLRYFVEATHQVIEKEGIDHVTIRKVADLAGYNSATLYNYFKNLDHLIFFASIKYLKEYALNLPYYIENAKNAMDTYLGIWECFCYYSFQKPKRYYALFFDKHHDLTQNTIKEYYEIFSYELDEHFKNILPMFLKQDIYDRNMIILEPCASEGFVKADYLKEINEMTILIYQGMLLKIINEQTDLPIDEMVENTLKYIKQIIQSYKNM